MINRHANAVHINGHNLMTLEKSIDLENHHHNLCYKHIYHLQKFSSTTMMMMMMMMG